MGFNLQIVGGVQIHFSGNSTLEGAMNWLDEHQTDADIDEALLVPEGGSVRSLSLIHISEPTRPY